MLLSGSSRVLGFVYSFAGWLLPNSGVGAPMVVCVGADLDCLMGFECVWGWCIAWISNLCFGLFGDFTYVCFKFDGFAGYLVWLGPLGSL